MSWGWAGVGVVNKANDNSNAADIDVCAEIARGVIALSSEVAPVRVKKTRQNLNNRL
jgi:hypothetical protein